MSVNVIPISSRSAPLDPRTLANGSYTLPAYAFIPHASLQQISSGHVGTPVPGMPAVFRAVPGPGAQNMFPTATLNGVYGARVDMKRSP